MQQNPSQFDFLGSPEAGSSRISEMAIPTGAHVSRHMLAGMLRELNNSEDSRWVCWIATSPIKTLLNSSVRQSGEHILQVVTRQAEELTRLAERALAGGRSHTVVVLLAGDIDDATRARLDHAARGGDADCLLIRVK